VNVPQQLGLLDAVTKVEKPWKVVRRVSRHVYAELRKSGRIGKQTHRVLTALAFYRNRTQEWPTAAELAAFMFSRGYLDRNDTRLVAPRLTELLRGKVVRLADGSKARKGGGVLMLLPVRTCRVTGARAHPVAIREAGSAERQVA
jgi:tetrahydrodipicolinate N-succinyltransferase